MLAILKNYMNSMLPKEDRVHKFSVFAVFHFPAGGIKKIIVLRVTLTPSSVPLI
jgi:hypothetical protein